MIFKIHESPDLEFSKGQFQCDYTASILNLFGKLDNVWIAQVNNWNGHCLCFVDGFRRVLSCDSLSLGFPAGKPVDYQNHIAKPHTSLSQTAIFWSFVEPSYIPPSGCDFLPQYTYPDTGPLVGNIYNAFSCFSNGISRLCNFVNGTRRSFTRFEACSSEPATTCQSHFGIVPQGLIAHIDFNWPHATRNLSYWISSPNAWSWWRVVSGSDHTP